MSAFMKPLVAPQPRDPRLDPLALGLPLTQAHPRQLGVDEHTIGDQPFAGRAVLSRQPVAHDPKVVDRDVRELRAAGALAHRPDTRRGCLQLRVDLHVAARVQLDAGDIEPDPISIRCAARSHQEVAALDHALAVMRRDPQPDLLA
jgi:hypothetical protein